MKELLKKITEAAKKAGASEVKGRESNPKKEEDKTLDVKIIFQRKPQKKGEKTAPPLNLTSLAECIGKDAGVCWGSITTYPAYQDPCVWLINVTKGSAILIDTVNLPKDAQ